MKASGNGGEFFPDPLYSTKLEQTDYCLLGTENILNGKMLGVDNKRKTAVGNFFDRKPVKFYTKGIHNSAPSLEAGARK